MVLKADLDIDIETVDYDDGEKFEQLYAKELRWLALHKKFRTPEGVRKTKPKDKKEKK